jgi:hypothetical protein
MINIENIVYSILSTDATVSAAFGTRIYPVIVPFDSVLPAIAYRISGVEPYETQSSASNMTKYSIQISVFSLTYSGLYALSTAVESAMIGHTNSSLSRVFFINASDDVQEIMTTADTTQSTGQYLYIRNLDFTLYKK